MIHLDALSGDTTEIIPLTAISDTALCVGAGGSSGSLADKPIVHTAANYPFIPASQLKGRLRHECEKLARSLGWPACHAPTPQCMCPERADWEGPAFEGSAYWLHQAGRYHCPICQIFGNPVLPARVQFDDLICHDAGARASETIRPGVTLNRRRRTAEDQKLYFLETTPANAQLRFEGEIALLPPCPRVGKPLIAAALQHVQALGGSKSAGMGWLRWDFSAASLSADDWSSLHAEAAA